MTREKRLGRGLEALLGKVAASEQKSDSGNYETAYAPTLKGVHRSDDPEWALQQSLAHRAPGRIDIMLVDVNPYQPRKEFADAELDSLAESLQTHGMLQPLVVRKTGDRYQLIAGERRFRAALRAAWTEIPVHVLNVDDRQMAELALTENLQRVDLNAIEKANAFARYLDVYGGTHEELAKRLEIDRSSVSNLLRLLELPPEIQAALNQGLVSFGHVRALLSLPAPQQIDISKRIAREGWSVRQTEQFVKEIAEWNERGAEFGGERPGPEKKTPEKSVHLEALEQEFRNRLGTKVKLSLTDGKGKGKITIPFSSNDEFERLYKMLCR
ncbi:MAG TPA: chromosome partitioning protein ParB [Planctomycetaceae bacterium]|nr:chromosome partitioning protein ParB [Planctomycetaceae bacterium]